MTSIVLAFLLTAALAMPAGAAARPGRTELASKVGGATAAGISTGGVVSADGRYVTFNSNARDLVDDKTHAATDAFVTDLHTGETERVSVTSEGGQANSNAHAGGMSSDGRYVVFTSYASNLVPDDTNGRTDTFVHDRSTGETERVSVAADGTEANGPSQNSAISADGRYVAFASRATNITPEATSGQLHAFVKDRVDGTVYLASRSTDEIEGNGPTFYPSLSGDGRYITYYTFATNLVAGDTNARNDVFVHDIVTRKTERVSVTWTGGQANDSSVRPVISGNGRFVAFSSHATNLVPSAATGQIFPYDVFVRDREARTTTRVSTSAAGVLGDGASYVPEISDDGRFITFTSLASNLVPGDTNGMRDAYIHDRHLLRTERVSVGPNEEEGNGHSSTGSVTPDGAHVAFFGQATNFVPSDTNDEPDVFVRERGGDLDVVDLRVEPTLDSARVTGDATISGSVLARSAFRRLLLQDSGIEVRGAELIHHAQEDNLLFRWHLNGMQTMPLSGTPAAYEYLGFAFTTPSGRYEIRVQDDLEPQASTRPFGTKVELYKCAAECVHVADLPGSLGTTGPEARAALPLKTIGLSDGDPITGMRAYLGLGHRTVGESGRIDGVDVPDAVLRRPSVSVGTAPIGTSSDDVQMSKVDLNDGHFDVRLPAPDGSFRTWVRVCLGQSCSLRSVDVERDAAVDPDEPVSSSLALTLQRAGNQVVASAHLVDEATGAGLSDRAVVFDVNGETLGTATTDASGVATLRLTKSDVKKGDTVRATFAGDDEHLPSQASATFDTRKG